MKKLANVLVYSGPKTKPSWYIGHTRVAKQAGEWVIVVKNVRQYTYQGYHNKPVWPKQESFEAREDLRFEGLKLMEARGPQSTYRSLRNSALVSITWV